MGKRGPQATPIADLIFWEGLWYWVFRHLRGVMPSYERLASAKIIKAQLRAELEELRKFAPKDLGEKYWVEQERKELERDLRPRIPDSEPPIWHSLVTAEKAADIRKACQESKRWLNPKWQGRPYVRELYDHAEQFVRAKRSPYYPRRNSGDEKRIIFFARAMAGISLGLSPNTSIHKLRKIRHGAKCPCVNCDLGRWDRIDQKSYQVFPDAGSDAPARSSAQATKPHPRRRSKRGFK